ncbi:hypothetical protein GCM10023187_42900 [Nibrella viscosa]|uniref:Adhesin domain-containing protein n=1 Tax=Nibrella viscosa TaxID=1084524 RepID=A0ABP8KS85_9BACT
MTTLSNYFLSLRRLSLGLLGLLASPNLVQAQAVVQVATRTVERSVDAAGIRTLHIVAEKADIELAVWDKATIAVKLELSARHPDKTTATNDLAKVQYVADRSGRDFFLRNFILLKDGEAKPLSNLKARYTVYLPASCAVDVRNSFGTVTMKGVRNSLRLKADFCISTLTDIMAKGTLETSFGELTARSLSGTFVFATDHTNLRLEQPAGSVKLNAAYGTVDILPDERLTGLTIQSKKAVVNVFPKNWQQFDYAISGAYATLQLPNGFNWKRNTADFKEAFFSSRQTATVSITAEFGDLTIK